MRFFDLQRAFPSLSYAYLFSLLEASKAPVWFKRSLAVLYGSLLIQFNVGGTLSQICSLQRGLGQGCPLAGGCFEQLAALTGDGPWLSNAMLVIILVTLLVVSWPSQSYVPEPNAMSLVPVGGPALTAIARSLLWSLAHHSLVVFSPDDGLEACFRELTCTLEGSTQLVPSPGRGSSSGSRVEICPPAWC